MVNRIILVTGTPGAGKTSIILQCKSSSKIKYEDVTVGTLMENIAKQKGYIQGDRDQIRYLPNDRITELRQATFSSIAGMKGNVVVDTHASIEQHGRYVPGLPASETMLLEEGLKAIVCVDASTTDILMRRASDQNRRREVEDTRLVDMQRIINLSALSYYSLYLNIPLYVIDNKQDMLDTAVKRFEEIINEIFK